MYPVYARKELVHEREFSREPSFERLNWCCLFGIARAIQGLCIQYTEFLVAAACKMSHLE